MCTFCRRWCHRHHRPSSRPLLSSTPTTTTLTVCPSVCMIDEMAKMASSRILTRTTLRDWSQGACVDEWLLLQFAVLLYRTQALDQIASHFVTGHARGHWLPIVFLSRNVTEGKAARPGQCNNSEVISSHRVRGKHQSWDKVIESEVNRNYFGELHLRNFKSNTWLKCSLFLKRK